MRSLVIGVLGIAAAAGSAFGGVEDAGGKVGVVVSILPQAYFVERVGGECVEVEVLVGEGQSPHLYRATPRQMVRIGQSKLYFTIGVECERALVPRLRKMFPELKLVDTRAGVPLRRFARARGHRHDHEHGDHAHDRGEEHGAPTGAAKPEPGGAVDPHIWLSPKLVKIQAQTICDALCEADPDRADAYRRNLAAFQVDLDRVHDEIAKALAPLEGREVYVYHPAFGYFLDEFGLEQVPVEIEGKSPAPRQLVQLIEEAKAGGVRVVFVQAQFSRKSAAAVAEAIGGAVVAVDPLARDYLDNLRRMAAALRKALKT